MTLLAILIPVLGPLAFGQENHDHGSHPMEGSDVSSVPSDGFFEFFRRLFRSDFMPHGHCYFWRPEIVWLHVISDAVIALSYFSIPLMLILFVRKRMDLPFHWVFRMFGAFILCCGATHVLDVVTLWYPMYRLDGVVRALTALISAITAVALYSLIPKALALRSPKELEEKNQELASAYATIKDTEKLRDEFFAKISHELRTPLTLILAPLESLRSEAYGSINAEQRSILNTIHNNCVRLLQMITGILDFSKIEAGKVEVDRVPTSVVSLTKSIGADFEPVLRQKNLNYFFHCPFDEMGLSLDRYLFERILFNLLSNAVKFTPAGGDVTVSLGWVSDRLSLSVRDSGVGIPKQELTHIFERFRQVENSSSRRYEGTGLGLSLVNEFATLLSGSVRVESEMGQGTTFVVEMLAPAATVSVGKIAGGRPKMFPTLSGAGLNLKTEPGLARQSEVLPKILIAEDNAELAEYIRSLLEPMAEIRSIEDGEQAFTLAKAWIPDLILSDVMMPKMDGLQLCKAVKSNASTGAIPVVLLTALSHRDALLKGWEAGANEYLFKPFHPTELVTRIRTLLQVVEQRRNLEEQNRRREELQQFAYFASHDLKEPLRTLTSYAQLLQKRNMAELGPDGAENLQFIIDAAKRMYQLIEDLVAYSLVSSGAPELERVDFNDVLVEVEGNLSKALNDSGGNINRTALPVVWGNRGQSVQLMQNLIGNALKFRSEAPIEIRITAEKLEKEWLFTVKDNGIGFDQVYADQIFVVFKRLHGQKAYPGTGIGLAICKSIVERLGGRIWAESELGKGAAFKFTVPIPTSSPDPRAN